MKAEKVVVSELEDAVIEFADGTTVTCTPKTAVYILRGLRMTSKDDGNIEKDA